MKIATSLLAGLLFGAGVTVAEMTNPAKVQAFLDIAGNWDPSLALVMGSALLVSGCAYLVAGRRSKSLLGEPFQIPQSSVVDVRLLVGAAIFGVGWGLGGFCPGPALAALVTGSQSVLLFAGSMLLGILLTRVASAASFSRAESEAA